MKRKMLQEYRTLPPATFDSIGQLVEFADAPPQYESEPVIFETGRSPAEVHFHRHTYISHHVEHVRIWMNHEPGLMPTREGFVILVVVVAFLVFGPELVCAVTGCQLPGK